MFHNGDYSIWGMHLIWWFVWLVMIFWIFAIPFDIPGQRKKKDSAFEILRNRLASGQITNDEYQEKKKILEIELVKQPV